MPRTNRYPSVAQLWTISLTMMAMGACAENNRGGNNVDGAVVPSGETVDVANSNGSDENTQDDDTPWDGAPDSSDSGPEDDAPPCAEITAEAQNLYLPVDIIWAIDSSGSMGQEIDLIQERMNGFADFVENSGLDYQIVLLAEKHESSQNTYDVCLPPPLSSVSSCPDEDGPRYRHIRRHVDSTSALEEIRDAFPEYREVLREGASVHMVVVSDDETSMGGDQFLTDLQGLGHAPLVDNLTFHSIVSDYNEDCLLGFCWETGCNGPYGSADNWGEEYINLSAATGGVFSDICNAEWDPIFDAIADTVLATTRLPCSFAMPETPAGLVVDFEEVEISFTSETGTVMDLSYVASEGACGANAGWYYDDPSNPASINLCPNACGEMYGDLLISFGCTKG